MRRERISDLYEDFEPEVRNWPYFVLGLLIPLVPLALSLAVGGRIDWILVSKYLVSVLPLVFTSVVMRDGEKAWLLPVSGGLYASLQLLLWVVHSLEGAAPFPLGIPFPLALSPSILSFVSYSFFQKRKRGKWLGFTLVSLILSLSFTLLCMMDGSGSIIVWRGIFPSLLLLLSISLFLVTRRSDSTPWFIVLVLILLLLSSAVFHSGVAALLEGGNTNGISVVSVILGVFVHDNEFWYTLSFFFVFAGLANKSSYRIVVDDIGQEEEGSVAESFTTPMPQAFFDEEKREGEKYTFPPEYSRFSGDTPPEEEKKEEPRVREEKVPPRPSYGEEYRGKSDPDDKWYEFIQGGVREERRPVREDDDFYRDDRRRRLSDRDRYREEIMYSPRYDDRRERSYRDGRSRSRYDEYDERPPRYMEDERDRRRRYRDAMDDEYDDRRYRPSDRDYRDYDYPDRDRGYRDRRDWDD